MGFFQLKKSQIIPATLEEVWAFISSPVNLKAITPDYIGFDITSSDMPNKMYPGMIISYKVSPIAGIKTTWVTEITQVKEGSYFVDEQRVGPYKMWHHQHIVLPHKSGTQMDDIISYQPPMGILGTIANSVFIKSKLEEIFSYRCKALDKIFGNSL